MKDESSADGLVVVRESIGDSLLDFRSVGGKDMMWVANLVEQKVYHLVTLGLAGL